MNQFPYLYPHSLSEAERLNEEELWQDAGADVNGFAPVTFEEMQENNYRHKAGWNPELCTMEADQ